MFKKSLDVVLGCVLMYHHKKYINECRVHKIEFVDVVKIYSHENR